MGSSNRPMGVAVGVICGLLLALGGCSEKHERVGPDEPQAGASASPNDFDNADAGGAGSNAWVGDGDAAVCPPDRELCDRPDAMLDARVPDPGRDADVPGAPDLDASISEPEPDATVVEPPADASVEPDADVIDPPEPDAEVVDPPDAGDAGGEPSASTYKIDLLFVVDNSGSMRQEQLALRDQFPMLITRLLANTAIGGGTDVVAGAQDIHLGVVSTDLGIPGIYGIPGCDGVGDNGELNNVAADGAVGCSAAVYAPRFLSYVAGTDDVAQLATDLGCISTLGTDGCGFEQQLESALKSVWPGDDARITFLADPSGFGATGQSGAAFPNTTFVRHDAADPSVVAVVLVTDEEDCSSGNSAHFRPVDATVPVDSPLRQQGLNTRCYYEGQRAEPNNLYDVSRYVSGLRALRGGAEHLVVFGAIVGVPPELVTRDQLASVDFTDASERAGFYDRLLSDPSMQATVDPRGTPEADDDTMLPSCRTDSGSALAYPPRRIVEVARGFGENGFVQSICADDWSPAMELLATRIAEARRQR